MPLRVLIYSMSADDSAVAVKVIAKSQLDARAVTNADQLRAELEAGVGALLIMEEALVGHVLAAVRAYVAAQPAWSDLPILILTKRGADSVEVQRAMEHLGNVTLLERPVRTMALVSALQAALRGRKRQYEVRALNERKDQMLATLAHELRNPLAPIRNAMEVLQRMYPDPKGTNLMDIVKRQTTHLKRLVDDLLDVARITNGKLELQMAPTSVAQVVTHALEIAEGAINAHGHRLAVRQPEEPVRLRADHVRLVQAVSNLLLNAAKFTPPGGDITLNVTVTPPVVEFSVTDTGRGIEPQALARIFDMFEQSRAVGEPSAGLGLGLHLARAFAELHGGSARAKSGGLGQGSEFTLSLPIVAPNDPNAAGHGSRVVPLAPRRGRVVYHNASPAHTLQALLPRLVMTAAAVPYGAAAVEYVRGNAPEAVVMDIGMPVMNGYEAARLIRQMIPKRDIVLIALTGWGQYADKARAAEAGFDFHFVKPLQIEDLMACLARAGSAQAA